MTLFKTLCRELNLSTTYTRESNLIALESWCRAHISQDVCFQGDSKEKYKKYLTLAENYLDNFITNLPNNLQQKVSFYNHLNAICFAAQQGYDQFITAQSVLPEQLVNEADAYGMTSLHHAASQGHLFTVKALLAKGANVHKVNAQMQLPIHSALFVPVGHDEKLLIRKEQIVRALLPLTPEALSVQDKAGNTLLHLLAKHDFNLIVAELVAKNPKLAFVANNSSLYPIHIAILNQQQKTIDVLLTIKGVSSLADGQECLPIHYAARYGTSEMIQSCCNSTIAHLNSQDTQERTPLLWAAYVGNQEVLETLIKNGADLSLTDYQGFSVLDAAADAKHESMVNWLTEYSSDLSIDHKEFNSIKTRF